ncbi:hypothetical protein B0T14DRAFT_562155 [Immersiella caudata]|uniref:Uncharacterized protein n=1 Tax=Immersiella caudata TaxID=314043 RepID=A0AA40C5Y7_9PEZI|nr:hypothetical protein B0T14DRAFT_562155 [Immersiella caudata]
MSLLVEAGLRRLIGIKGPLAGIKTTRKGDFPSLIDLAPAVWNLQYLQSLTAHAKVIPVIAQGIARLSNSRSSVLREKAARLRDSQAREGTLANQRGGSNGVEQEVTSRLWTLCQTNIYAEPIAKSNTRRFQDLTQKRSQLAGESSAAELYESDYFETLGSQDGYVDHSTGLNHYREHQSFLDYPEYESEGPELIGSVDLEPYYGMEEQSVVEFAPGELYLLERYADLPERFPGQRIAMGHGPFDTSLEVNIPSHRDIEDGLDVFGLSAVHHNVDSLLDEDVALPATLADGTDGSLESEGDYYYVDEQGNCFHIDDTSFADEGSSWDRRPSASEPIQNYSAVLSYEQ